MQVPDHPTPPPTVRTGILLLAALLSGCAALVGNPSLPPVAYRELTLEDFQARRPPEHLKAHANSVGAALCGQLVLTDDSGFAAGRLTHADGSQTYIVRMERLRFRGEMLPGCSWWNPQVLTRDMAHVLQHEQIHFALIEIAARRLNASSAELVNTFESRGPTRRAAEATALDTIEAITAQALAALQERHTRFDTETRHHVMPEHRQFMWWQQVQQELAESAPDTP